MTRLSQVQAVEFLEGLYVFEPDMLTDTYAEAYILGTCMSDVREDLEAFCTSYGIALDPDSVEITPDHDDGLDMVATKVVIRLLGEGASS